MAEIELAVRTALGVPGGKAPEETAEEQEEHAAAG
jgi:hypothetical protein